MLDAAPTDLVVYVPLTSREATLDFTENAVQPSIVVSPSGEELVLTTDVVLEEGPLRYLYTFLTDIDGIYVVKAESTSFCLPILGRLYACRNQMLLASDCCVCGEELDKTLRTLDALLRCIVALASCGKATLAQDLYTLAATLCCTCGCSND